MRHSVDADAEMLLGELRELTTRLLRAIARGDADRITTLRRRRSACHAALAAVTARPRSAA